MSDSFTIEIRRLAMGLRRAAFMFAPTSVDEAPGVTIRRAIGGDRMAILDPFLLLDHPTVAAGSEVAGFPRHPHRGIETLSYVFSGEVGHKDSLGNQGTVGEGGSQWMTAGNGIFHEEMLIPGPNGAEFLQLWFSLPQSLKRVAPRYVGANPDSVPEVAIKGGAIRVVAGSFEGAEGPFKGIAVNPTVLDIRLDGNASLTLPTIAGEAAFVYVIHGSLSVGEKSAISPQLVVLSDGDSVQFDAGSDGARALFVSAKPLNEPILQYRSLVMNTVEDIEESVKMIESGSFASA